MAKNAYLYVMFGQEQGVFGRSDGPFSGLTSLTPVQKRAVLKVAIELVKADNQIHSKEVSVLNALQGLLHLRQDELDLVHYVPLSDAVSVIREMEGPVVRTVMDVFDAIMRVDSDVDFEENLLYAAVLMSCQEESRGWSRILSVPDLDLDLSDRQIVFLEKSFSAEAHRVLDDRYDNLLISKAFGDVGISLFYLPNVLKDLGLAGDDPNGRFEILQESMGYLMPAGDRIKVEGLKESLGSLDSGTFFKVVLSRFGLAPDQFPFDAFLLVKVRNDVVLDDENAMHGSADFFCLDISADVKHRILSFVSLFGDTSYLLPYEGYYRILFDYFSSESKLNSEILLDRDFNFTLHGLDGRRISFESSPQARTLYLLLLRYGRDGIGQETFDAATRYLQEAMDSGRHVHGDVFDMAGFETELLEDPQPWKDVIFNAIRIYRSISTKDGDHPGFLSYIVSILSHRSSLKTYLNKGFDAVRELAAPSLYHVRFDRETHSYQVGIDRSMFLVDEGPGGPVPLSESRFWRSLR